MNRHYAKRWQSAPVYRAQDLIVTAGVNVYQDIYRGDDLCLGDVYRVAPDARCHRLSAFEGPDDHMIVSEGTMLGAPGSTLHFDARLTFLSETGTGVEMTLIIETDETGQTANVYFQPDQTLDARWEYELIMRVPVAPNQAHLSVPVADLPVDPMVAAPAAPKPASPAHLADRAEGPDPDIQPER